MNKPIHLSFDIDGLDVAVAPSTGTPGNWRNSHLPVVDSRQSPAAEPPVCARTNQHQPGV